jgi:hypothetical protein
MTNGQEVRKLYVLHAHIPILEEAHHSGWTLALVDTPGFGEANVEHVTSHADMLFSTSTAYLYMMDSSNLEDAVDAANIRQLYQYDKELFNDGRFVVAISKYDLYLSAQSLNQQRNRRTQRRDTHVKEHSPQQTTKSFIAASIGIEPPPDIAIPVSAEWAELAQYLRQDPTDADIQKARGILALYPDSQPQGQGEVEISPPTLAASLQRISGIPDLEERLRTIIAHCIHIWQTSLVKAYTSYLQEAKEVLTCNHQQRMEEKDYIQSKLELHERYQDEKAKLCSRAFADKYTKTEFQLMLEEKYAEFDVKAAERLLHGWINEMVNRFSDMTKMQVEHGEKPFLQHDYEAAMKKFIEEEVVPTLSREQENMKLDGVAAAFRDSLDDMDKLDREIEDIAESIVPSGWSPDNDLLRKDRDKKSEKGIISDHVLQMKQLTLKDLQRRTNAPPLSIGRIQRFFDRVKRLFGMAVTPDEERPYRKWGKEMNDAMLSLKDDLVSEVDAYVTGSLQRWIIYEVLSPAYGNRVKNRAMALVETYDRVINEEKARLETAFELCNSDMSSLDENIKKINAVLESLTV